ncbi:MAG TPA: RNA polymerase sigma factor [Parafilimonas sp.]|nr:RNA polymerase sigma factor [Parafilimonas sp.]
MSITAQQKKENTFFIRKPLPEIEQHVVAARAGEKTAWNVLYQHYYPELFATALRMLNDIDAAKDAIQECFINAHLKLAQLKDAVTFSHWLKKILIRICYRSIQYSKNKYRNALPVETDAWWEDEFNKKLDKLYVQNHLHAALANLHEVLRSTLLLRYFSDFTSYEEIANILAIPVGTVRSRLNQAKLKLAQLWKQNADSDTKVFRQSQEWNHFYYANFSGMHYHDNCKNKLVSHLEKNILLIVPGIKPNIGKSFF